MIKYSINDSLKIIVRDLEKVAEKKCTYSSPPPVFAINPVAFKGIPDELQLKRYYSVLEDGTLYNIAPNIALDENTSRYY